MYENVISLSLKLTEHVTSPPPRIHAPRTHRKKKADISCVLFVVLLLLLLLLLLAQ